VRGKSRKRNNGNGEHPVRVEISQESGCTGIGKTKCAVQLRRHKIEDRSNVPHMPDKGSRGRGTGGHDDTSCIMGQDFR
jgi:hypothetical protein